MLPHNTRRLFKSSHREICQCWHTVLYFNWLPLLRVMWCQRYLQLSNLPLLEHECIAFFVKDVDNDTYLSTEHVRCLGVNSYV
mmetsp:Transcript_22537/g.51137  ORF Transcript_22537/g.51137 Transcript_22537/m.51137 type:complete len:83 (-) Transcript_22537:33-281(-)